MAHESQLTNDTEALISHADEDMTSPATLPPTVIHVPEESASSLRPGQHRPPGSAPATAPPYTQHDLEAIGNDSMAPPPSYTELAQGPIVGDSKTQHHTCALPSLSLLHVLKPNHDGDSSSLLVGAPEQAGSLQLCDAHRDNDSAGRDELSLVLEPIPIYCTTNCTPASEHLNWHVNPDNNVYRWRTTEGDIPVGIDLQSFESAEQKFLVTKCFKIVLRKLNNNNIGPQFKFEEHPHLSAFFITFGGDHPQRYASSFFPGWDPKDWYIYVYKRSLTLSSAQEQSLNGTKGGDTKEAKSQALEQNLIKILTHEMLHVVGVRHCVVNLDQENEPYWRFPRKLSNKDNLDPLMKPTLDWNDLSQSRLKRQTLHEIRQVYAMKEGKKVYGMKKGKNTKHHRIRDVSWKDGPRKRKDIAEMTTRCCTP